MVNNICMLSTHGYFDPIPQLGRTDTGGQVTYVIELAKALTTLGKKVDIYTRWFDQSKQQIDPVPDWPDVRVIRIPAGSWEFLPKEFIYDVLHINFCHCSHPRFLMRPAPCGQMGSVYWICERLL